MDYSGAEILKVSPDSQWTQILKSKKDQQACAPKAWSLDGPAPTSPKRVSPSSSFIFRWDKQYNDKPSQYTYTKTNWEALLKLAQQVSGDTGCFYEGEFHAGGRHIVRRLRLPTIKQLWLARIPTIPQGLDEDTNSMWWTNERQFTMESEIATMKFISQATTIPVPKVFAYHTGIDNNLIGLPYVIMECIEGNMLYDIGDPEVLTKEQKKTVQGSIASIQCKLANVHLKGLGSPILETDGTIGIGPLPAQFGFQGPFKSSRDYLRCWADSNETFCNIDRLATAKVDERLIQSVTSFPKRLSKAAESMMIVEGQANAYPIIHPDFNVHNLLFDNELNLVGVIDWELAFSAPLEIYIAQMNPYASLDAKAAKLKLNEETKAYIEEVREYEMDSSMDQKIHHLFGSQLGNIGLCMRAYEQGSALFFDQVF